MTIDEVRALRDEQLIDWMFAQNWYAKPNDLIGGWSVMPVDGTLADGWPAVTDMMLSEDPAEYISETHNRRLRGISA